MVQVAAFGQILLRVGAVVLLGFAVFMIIRSIRESMHD